MQDKMNKKMALKIKYKFKVRLSRKSITKDKANVNLIFPNKYLCQPKMTRSRALDLTWQHQRRFRFLKAKVSPFLFN